MKYLVIYLITLFLGLSLGLSAQSFRVRADLGATGLFNPIHIVGPSAGLGLEALIPLAPRTFLVPEVGVQHRAHYLTRFNEFPILVIGQLPIDFTANEDYQVQRTEALLGLGIERHLERFRVQVGTRAAYRIQDKITFSEQEVFSSSGRPDNLFEVSVAPGEAFTQGMQTGTIDYNNQLHLTGGFSVRYDFTGAFELGISLWRTVGRYRLERRVISFCENCPIDENMLPEVSLHAGTTTIQISSRISL